MFDTILLSDDGCHVIIFHGEPEVMEINDFVSAYGREMLPEPRKLQPKEVLKQSEKTANPEETKCNSPVSGKPPKKASPEDIKKYWEAFRKLAKACGKYSHDAKLQENANDGILITQVVRQKFHGSEEKLAKRIDDLNDEMTKAMEKLVKYSEKVGFRMSTPEDVKEYNLQRRADTEILLGYLLIPKFRERTYYRIDKFAKKGELKSPAEIVVDVAESFTLKKSRQPS